MNTKKNLLLIVGAFPKKPIHGGIYTSSKLIIESTIFSDFELLPFDSSQISNPPPPFIVRFYLASIRFFLFLNKLLIKRPDAALIFCSDGASALEKGVFVWLCKIFDTKTFIFPRAGKLIQQTKQSVVFRIIIKFFFKKASIFLAQGDNWCLFAQEVLNISEFKIKKIHNWTATKDLLEVGLHKKYNKKKKVTKFLFVGWLEKEKGIYEILEALKKLQSKKHQFIFTFVGDGNGMITAKQFVNENNLSKQVIFKGWVSQSVIQSDYESADVFVLPSWVEGMPNALIEALSCGLAAVVSNVGMIPNYLENGKNALIVTPQKSYSLYTAMEKLILDTKLKINISKNGYKVANEYFSTDKGLTAMASIIKSTLKL